MWVIVTPSKSRFIRTCPIPTWKHPKSILRCLSTDKQNNYSRSGRISKTRLTGQRLTWRQERYIIYLLYYVGKHYASLTNYQVRILEQSMHTWSSYERVYLGISPRLTPFPSRIARCTVQCVNLAKSSSNSLPPILQNSRTNPIFLYQIKFLQEYAPWNTQWDSHTRCRKCLGKKGQSTRLERWNE